MAHPIRIGTSGWAYDDWVGPFYTPGTGKGDYLEHYARVFDIVEVDSTYYRPPNRRMVQGWADRTPDAFTFALKTSSTITHEKVLADCEGDMEQVIEALEPLRPKLKCLLLQFGYFNRQAFRSAAPFFERLDAFFDKFAARVPLACEIRNKSWLGSPYFDLLRAHNVSATLAEHAWLPPLQRIVAEHDVVTGPLAYVRLLGDRKRIEEITKKWDQTVIERGEDLRRIAQSVREIARRAEVLVFINNHYAGHAPTTCRALADAL